METRMALSNDDCQDITFVCRSYDKETITIVIQDHVKDSRMVFTYEKERLLQEMQEILRLIKKLDE